MLSKQDIKWIKSNREEITKNRLHPVTLVGEVETGRDIITDEPITEDITENVKALVTEITSAFKTDISLEGGVEVVKGDLWVVIDLGEFDVLGYNEFNDILYYDVPYRVLAADREGIGEFNRVTIVARKVS